MYEMKTHPATKRNDYSNLFLLILFFASPEGFYCAYGGHSIAPKTTSANAASASS